MSARKINLANFRASRLEAARGSLLRFQAAVEKHADDPYWRDYYAEAVVSCRLRVSELERMANAA